MLPPSMGKVAEMEHFRRGVLLAMLIERRLAGGGQLVWYHPKQKKLVAPLNLQAQLAESSAIYDTSMCFKLEGEGFFALEELEGSSRYAAYMKPKAPLYRYLVRLYTNACRKHHKEGLALVEMDDGEPVRELRLPGCRQITTFNQVGDIVEQGLGDPVKRDLIQGYIGDRRGNRVYLFADVDGKAPAFDDTLFLCRVILSTWTNQRADVVAFVNSAIFTDVVEAIWKARRGAFSDKKFPAAAKAYLYQHRLGRATVTEIEEASRQLHQLLVKRTQEAIDRYEGPGQAEQTRLSGLAACSAHLKATALRNPLHPRDFIRLWQYESLDCRAAWWIEREARRHFVGKAQHIDSPMVNMAFRLLCRVADNVEDRKNAFKMLNDLDLANTEKSATKRKSSHTVKDIEGLKKLLEGLNDAEGKDQGWSTHPRSPWLTGRDQTVRCCVIGEQLRNRLDGSPLTFSYAAYDLHDGVAQMCWSHAGQLFEDSTMSRNLVEVLVEEREFDLEQDNDRDRFIGQGLKVHLEDGCLVAAHTVRRAFTLEIRGEDQGDVDQVMDKIIRAADITAHAIPT